MVFNIYYTEDTGKIVGYQDGGTLTPQHEIPPGCKRLAFATHVGITDPMSHRINMRVDVTTKQLVLLDLPKVIEEKDMVLDLEEKLQKAQADLVMAVSEDLKDYEKFIRDQIADISIRLDRAKMELGKVEKTSV